MKTEPVMFDLRRAESERIRMSAANARLEVRYTELTEGVHHYSIVGEYQNEALHLALRLTAGEALAFLEGYRFGLDSRQERDRS